MSSTDGDELEVRAYLRATSLRAYDPATDGARMCLELETLGVSKNRKEKRKHEESERTKVSFTTRLPKHTLPQSFYSKLRDAKVNLATLACGLKAASDIKASRAALTQSISAKLAEPTLQVSEDVTSRVTHFGCHRSPLISDASS
ncbi:hypothetical protein EVAR_61433_1 [Eumeta japonica]|uniref:Uncharacterized protein n=1 Tax=Eumeta variegata TaxID=151549 RepID=A0A4C1Y3P5_EUMVA|nr:hypothetical protein EVAR_61433_1 [Eumeta japonica]